MQGRIYYAEGGRQSTLTWEPWEGSHIPPALWLWRAKPAFAYAIMGTQRPRLALRPPHLPPPTLASLGLTSRDGAPRAALAERRATRARARRAGRAGWGVGPEVPEGGARLRLRDPIQLGEQGPVFFGQRVLVDQVRTAQQRTPQCFSPTPTCHSGMVT